MTCEIQDSDKHFVNCMTEIMVRLKNYGSLFVDSLEFMRNEYVAAILHAALNIARVDTQKEFSMRSQCEMLGEESIGRVDYAITIHSTLISLEKFGVTDTIIFFVGFRVLGLCYSGQQTKPNSQEYGP